MDEMYPYGCPLSDRLFAFDKQLLVFPTDYLFICPFI